MFCSTSFLFLSVSLLIVLADAGSVLIQQQQSQQGQGQQQQVVAIQSAPLVMAYYPDWIASSFPPERIDFGRFDWIDFAFAIPDSNYGLSWDDPDAPGYLSRLVAAAHASGKKVKLSIGGWSGSMYFSGAVSTNETRSTFVSNICDAYKSFDLDGIDIDWEFPASLGAGGNMHNSNDTANFLSFLQLLRSALPFSAKISAATQLWPFAGPDGHPIKDTSMFAEVLDWILLMNYDVWGSSSIPGPNAPFYDACGNSTQPGANAVGGYDAWTSSGFPASQLVLGVPSYGYVSKSNATSLRTRLDPRHLLDFLREPRDSGAMAISNDGDPQVQFNYLVEIGALVKNGSSWVGAGDFNRQWDDCSNTPFLRNPSNPQVVTYDDPKSLGMKAAFAKRVGMLGVNMFDVHGDTDDWTLIDAVRDALL